MTDITTNETPNTRLANLIKELGSTDTTIAKAIAVVTGKSISKTSVATHMPDGGNKKIKDDFFITIGDALPFLNAQWLKTGKGQMLKDWSSKQQNDFILKSKWYANLPAKSEPYDEKKYANLYPEARAIIKATSRWDSQDKVKKELKATPFKDVLKAMFKSTYSSGTLRVDVDRDLCNRFKEIRMMSDPKQSQQQFADKLGVMRAMITSIESWRQNPSHHLMVRMWEQLSSPNQELNFKWLHTGDGKMFISSSGGSDEAKDLKIKELEAQLDKKEQIIDMMLTAQGQRFSH